MRERQWMKTLADALLNSGTTQAPRCLRANDDEETQKRYRVLQAGFGLRTFKILSENFSNFREACGKNLWHQRGGAFSAHRAPECFQYGLLPEYFLNWCESLELTAAEKKALEIDGAILRSKTLCYSVKGHIDGVSDLESDPVLSLQNTVVPVASQFIVVSRLFKESFVIEVPNFLFRLVLDYQRKSFRLTEIAERLGDEKLLAQWVQLGLTHHWFVKTSLQECERTL